MTRSTAATVSSECASYLSPMEPPQVTGTARRAAARVTRRPIRVIEDDAAIRSPIVNALIMGGYSAVAAAHDVEALDVVEQYLPRLC
jgi:hypothetical protein